MTTAGPSVTDELADFAATLTPADLPSAVLDHVRLHLLDTIGCGLAGAGSDLACRAFAFLDLEHAPGPCGVLGTSRRYGPAAAAFANAVAMNGLDFDDGHEVEGRGMGHPSATIVAAAISAAAMADVDGPGFVTALAAAYEVNARIVEALQPSVARFRQVYGVCQHQTIGAAIAYGRALGIPAGALRNAIGLAATLAPVPSLRKYNWERRPLISFKDFNAPAAEAGVRAVQLDGCGLVGSRDVLDGDAGFWRMIGSDRFDARAAVADLGRDWRLLSGSLKAYPACRWMHTAMEAFDTIRLREGLAPGDIESVEVHGGAALARDLMAPKPRTMVDAQFSLPYALAALAHGVAPAARWYEAESLRRLDLETFSARVFATVDPEIDALMSGPSRRPAARVTVRARGRAFASPLLTHPLGTRERPMTIDAVAAKFLGNAAPVLGAAEAAELREAIASIETAPDAASALGLRRSS